MILHIINLDKFIPAFIDFLEENFKDFERHIFFIIGDESRYCVRQRKNTIFFPDFNGSISRKQLSQLTKKANKVVLHGLFDFQVVKFLFFRSWVLKKCYWVIWGGDLYCHLHRGKGIRSGLHEVVRKAVIKRMGHLVTYIHGDVDLAREWYGAKGQYHECFMYPSNLYHAYDVPSKQGSGTNILVGNSGDPSNNHVEIFENILPYKGQDIKIYCPLSYGDAAYISTIVEKGESLFGDKFVPLLDFMPFEKYLELLGQVDIAIFAHKRQQAMGNTITLLGLGKKVYMRESVSPFKIFMALDINVYEFDSINLDRVDSSANIEKVKKCFSKDILIFQWKDIYD